MGLRRSTSARKVNPPSLVFIYLNIPALTPGLNYAVTSLGFSAFYRNDEFALWKKELMSFIKLVENSNLDNLYSKPECHVVSKAVSMSKITAAVDILLLKLRVTWSFTLMHWCVVLWRARKPNWLALSRLLSSMCFWIIVWMTSSDNLLVDRRLNERKFWGNFGSLPGFGNDEFCFLPRFWKMGQPNSVIK
jgi:hypothetical protein